MPRCSIRRADGVLCRQPALRHQTYCALHRNAVHSERDAAFHDPTMPLEMRLLEQRVGELRDAFTMQAVPARVREEFYGLVKILVPWRTHRLNMVSRQEFFTTIKLIQEAVREAILAHVKTTEQANAIVSDAQRRISNVLNGAPLAQDED